MSFRSIYQRLFSQDVESRHSIDEIIVHPTQRTQNPSTSQNSVHDNFQKIEDLMSFFKTSNNPYNQSLLKDTSKVLILKFETLKKPTHAELVQLSQICLASSIVILLTDDERSNFYIYWKSKDIKHFLTLKIYERADFLNDIKLFEFLADFLANSMIRGHLGLHSKVPIKPSINSLEFHLLADHRDYNLLLVAADVGDAHVVKLMLELGFNSDFPEINAQTLAWKNRNFEVLSLLLKSNLIYPYSIYIDECPEEIQNFYEISCELNEAILVKDRDKIIRIISQNKDMTFFYNLNNESALAFALNRRLFDMYEILISKNIMFGPHERFGELKEDMKESERKKLREIHYKESKILPDNHMHVLLSNSRLGHDTSEVQIKFKVIQNAFEILNGNPFIQIILKIVAASRNFRIIFDFNRDSVEVVDPTVDDSTDGLFYLSGRIYIGAKKLLDKDMKFDALGVLAHELCHYAISLVYKNSAKPYLVNDSKTKKTFGEIFMFCVENSRTEKLIDVIHKCYHESMHHAELIVRVPHLIMKYLNNPEKFNAVRSTFQKLFDVYEEKIFKEMKEALPRIEANAESEKEKYSRKIKKAKIIVIVFVIVAIVFTISGFIVMRKFYKPVYKFSTLSHKDKIRVENAPVIYKHVDIVFHDLFLQNSSAYYMLTSDDITQIFDEISLDFSNPHLYYLNDLIAFKWENLTEKLKDKFLTSNFTFQNELVTFEKMNLSNADIFNSLESNQIIDVLDGKSFVINKMIQNETIFYTERTMFTEYIYIIYYLFMIKTNAERIQGDCIYKNKTGHANDTFENFYDEYVKQNFEYIIAETNQIINMEYYKRCSSSGFQIKDMKTLETTDSLLNHTSFQKSFDEILIESGLEPSSNSSRIFILSADAGTGKTETFRQFALRIKRMYPTQWVSYINYRQNQEFLKKIKNLDDAKRVLARILEINLDNQIEKRVYEEYFSTGRMILLWDGYDQLPQNLMNDFGALSLLQLIKNHTTNNQFVSTRVLYSDKLRRTFKIEPFTLVPLSQNLKYQFLRDFFVSQQIKEQDISKYINKTQKIVDSTRSEDDFNTPLLLGMIAYIISNDTDIFRSENLYLIYQKFVEKKLQFWLNNMSDGSKLVETLLMNGISVPQFYQKYALRMIPDVYLRKFSRFSSLRLKVTSRNFPRKMKTSQISGMGILHFNSQKSYTFAHSTFVQFFIAQFIVQNIFKTEDIPSTEEADVRIQTFFWSIRDKGTAIFIESYFQSITSKNMRDIDPIILKLFQKKYKDFLVNLLQSRSIPIPILIEFFQRDHKLLTDMLQLSENGIYSLTFNYANFNFNSYDEINRTAIIESASKFLTTDEIERFISLNDYKGIILYTMYCVKQYRNSSEYARESFPGYDLPDDIFNSYNVSKVLTSIAKNLTSNELKKLITSKTVWYMLNILSNVNGPIILFRDNTFEFYETLLDMIEINLNEDEQKNWFSKILKFPFLLEDETTRKFLLFKVNKLFSDSEIHDLFTNLNILHQTMTIGNYFINFKRFEFSWNYFVTHTNWEQQKCILNRSVEMDCYLNQIEQPFCYVVPKINLLQASLLQNIGIFGNNNSSTKSFVDTIKIYRTYFSDKELQEMIIKGSKEFIPFLILVRSIEDCKEYAHYLTEIFKDKDTLREFLLSPVEPTKLNIFDLLFDLYDNRKKLEVFKRLLSPNDVENSSN